MNVMELCSTDLCTCRRETDLASVAGMMWERDCGIVPVVDERRHVVGVITDRDICLAVATRGCRATDLCVGDVISGEAFVCSATEDVRSALRSMASHAVRRLPVVNERHELVGVLSISDVIQAARDKSKVGALTGSDVLLALQQVTRPRPVTAERQV